MANDFASKLSTAFDRLIQKNYGSITPPPSIITPIGIKHLDALLGGGISSSLPVMISSTPETGKSSVSFQFCGSFIDHNPNNLAIYIDVETASNTQSSVVSQIEDRIQTLGINIEKFNYKPLIGDIPTIFTMISELIDTKIVFEEKTGEKLNLCIILDSIASLSCSKEVSANSPKEIIGYKANELSLWISKLKPKITMHNITFICIDQIRSNFKLDMYARNEKTVGEFGNVKAATSVASLHHNLKQWLFLSRGEVLNKTHPYGVDGWVMNCYTEKNKIAPSQFWVSVIFDKKYAIIPVLSEYHFLKELTKTEEKVYKHKQKKPPFPMFVSAEGHSKIIEIIDPTTGAVQATSQKFKESNLINLYYEDSQFKKIFDDAVTLSIDLRIHKGYFSGSFEPPSDNVEEFNSIPTYTQELEIQHEPPLEETTNMLI